MHGRSGSAEGIDAPRLTMLEKTIQVFDGVRMEGAWENGAASKRPSAPLNGTVEPPDQLAFLKRLHSDRNRIDIRRPLVGELAVVQRRFYFLGTICRSEERRQRLTDACGAE